MALTKDHYIQLKDGVFSGTTQDDLNSLFKTLEADTCKNKIVLHFHGGLVDAVRAMGTAGNLISRYPNVYQIFFIWETGINEVIEQEGGISAFVQALSKELGPEPVGDILTFIQVWLQVAQQQESFQQLFMRAFQNVQLQGADEQQYQSMLAKFLHPPLLNDALLLGQAMEVGAQVTSRLSQQTDHGLYTTVIEELFRVLGLADIGKHVWDHIKGAASDAFSRPDHGGAVFLQNLNTYCQDHTPHITLVGHSAGSIYICNFLQNAQNILPDNIKFDIVLLAPACTYKLFADTLQACGDRIASIRIFALEDTLEQTDVIVPNIYTRSLLYMVSGLFEAVPDTPILGMKRFFGNPSAPPFNQWPEIQSVCDYLDASQNRNVWSMIDAGNGLSSHAKTHGNFYSEDVTLTSLGYILANGLA